MQRLKELYLTSFVVFFRAFAGAWTPGLNAWKGVAGVTLIEWLVLVGIDVWIPTGASLRSFSAVNQWVIRAAVIALFFGNYFVLVARGHGIAYEREFSNLSRTRRTLLLAGSVVVMLAAIAFFVFSGGTNRRMLHPT